MTEPSASYILWLPSWYPNKLAPFDGDFIQRHAKAAALYNDIVVIYAVGERRQTLLAGVEESVTRQGSLAEHIIYFERSAGILGRVVTFLKWNKLVRKAVKQYIMENGKPDLVHVHVPMKAGLIAHWIKRRYNINYVVSEHAAHYKMGSHDDFFHKNFIYRKKVAGVFRNAIAVTNVSAALGNIIKEIFHLKDVYVINNTVDTNLFSYEDSHNKSFRFIHVSTLTESQKNVTGILNAVKSLLKQRRDFELVIVGPASNELKELVKNLRLENIVSLTGEISYADVSRQMKMATALVLFSRYENLPCVIIEALCCGLPVIATDVGGVRELVNETNGVLVQSENEDQLAESMDRMINEYKTFDREQIAVNARERFSYPTIGKQFNDLYKKTGG